MANSQRGEVRLGESGRVLRFTTNAQCRIETVLGVGFIEAAQGLQDDIRIGVLRAFVWGGLNDDALTLEDAGNIIDDVGQAGVLEAIGEALALAFPAGEDKQESGKPQAE